MTHDQGWPAFQQGGGHGAQHGASFGSGGGYGGGYDGGFGGGRHGRGPRRRNPLRGLLVLLVVLAVLGGSAAAAFVAFRDIDLPDVPGAAGSADAHSAEGLDDLREDVQEESGGTEVFGATIYPDYAAVDVPVDGTSERYESFRWDGDLDDFGSKSTSSDPRVDLADVDAGVMLDALAEAKSLVDDPEAWYVVIDGPSNRTRNKPTLSAYATNDFSETVYVQVTLQGKEIRRLVGDEVIEAPVSRG